MKDYYIEFESTITYKVIIRAETQEAAEELAYELEPDEMFSDESCRNYTFTKELKEGEEQEYDIQKYRVREDGSYTDINEN